MSILAGEIVTAARLQRLQPVTYYAQGSGTLVGASSNGDVPSATVTFNTATANAVYVATGVWDIDIVTATTAITTARIAVDGTVQSPLMTYAGEVATDRATVTQTYRGTLATAGSHTIKLVASPPANVQIQGANSSIAVTIYEIV